MEGNGRRTWELVEADNGVRNCRDPGKVVWGPNLFLNEDEMSWNGGEGISRDRAQVERALNLFREDPSRSRLGILLPLTSKCNWAN